MAKISCGNYKEIGIWTSVEINYALQRGYSFKFYLALIFPEKFNPFEPFIDKFFELKKISKGSIRQIAKIILNSCYGKFGQRVDMESTDIKFFADEESAIQFYEEKIDKNEKALMEFNEVYNQYSVRFTEKRTRLEPFQIVHLSSFITAYARIELIKSIHELTDNEIPIYYCDTDSIVTIENSILQMGKELGTWDCEDSFDEFKCICPKCYLAKNEKGLIIKVKGIRKDKIKNWLGKYDSILDVIEELKKEIEIKEQYLPLKSSFIRNKSALSSAKMIKKLALTDLKRKVLVNEDTIPLRD